MPEQTPAEIALDILNGYADRILAYAVVLDSAKLKEAGDALKSIIPTIQDALPKE